MAKIEEYFAGVRLVLLDKWTVRPNGKKRYIGLCYCPSCKEPREVDYHGTKSALLLGRMKGHCPTCKPKTLMKHTEDEVLANGSVICWSQRRGGYYVGRVPVICGCCGGTRWLALSTITGGRNWGKWGSGLCKKCQSRGPTSATWKGGRSYTADGYVVLAVSGLQGKELEMAQAMHYVRVVREHRLVMALYLRRPLDPDEHVHHKDLSRDNNDPRNLELRGPHTHGPEHARIPRRAQKELIRLYDLLDEHGVAHRKQLLRHLPWEYQQQVRQQYGAT